ncbi:MAG: hypothetical protein IPN70_02880 [Candidatus Moraniibacteriota bacterium]|nr:MAG: hypothetical protein IPN70_02880 [Candidatus Moranbacteria bacterium]
MSKTGRAHTKLGYFERNFFKNHQIFMEKMYENTRFFEEILEWHIKLKLTDEMVGDIFSIKSFKNHKLAHEYGATLGEKIIKDEDIEFMTWFNGFFSKFNLSKTWEIPVLNFIACGYYCPPETTSIKIESDKGDVVLRLDKNATLNDLRNSWPIISSRLDNSESPRRRISKTFFKNIEEQIKASKITKRTSLDGNTNEYETENYLDILYRIHDDDEKYQDKIDKDPEKAISKFKTNKHRLKRYIK